MSTVYGHADTSLGRADAPAPERSIGELFADLGNETGLLIRQELKLASTELTQKASLAGRQLAFVAAGGLLAMLGVLLLLQALVVGMAAYMPLWVSALIVGVVVSAVAAGLASKGITTLQHSELKPTQTLQSIEANKSIVQGQPK
jgi:hypothetical protein